MRGETILKISHYDWSGSNGPFKEIVGVESEEVWVEMCNKFIGELSPSSNSPEAISTDSLTESVVQTDVDSNKGSEENLIEKRKASAQLINQLTIPSKRFCDGKNTTTGADSVTVMRTKIESCRIGKLHSVVQPIRCTFKK